jgi:hypothetical protein
VFSKIIECFVREKKLEGRKTNKLLEVLWTRLNSLIGDPISHTRHSYEDQQPHDLEVDQTLSLNIKVLKYTHTNIILIKCLETNVSHNGR